MVGPGGKVEVENRVGVVSAEVGHPQPCHAHITQRLLSKQPHLISPTHTNEQVNKALGSLQDTERSKVHLDGNCLVPVVGCLLAVSEFSLKKGFTVIFNLFLFFNLFL